MEVFKKNVIWLNNLTQLATWVLGLALMLSCNSPKKQNSKKVDDVVTIKLSHQLSEKHPIQKALIVFSERVFELSDGKMKVDIYPEGQLGGEKTSMELLQEGKIEMIKVSAAVLEGYSDFYKIFSLPYLFVDKKSYYRFLDSQAAANILKINQGNLMGVVFFDAGYRSFYSVNAPILKPENLKNLKIRILDSEIAEKMFAMAGAQPIRIPFNNLTLELSESNLKAAENNPPTFYESEHYQFCKFFSLTEHAAVPDVLVINSSFWASLSENNQKIISEAAMQATRHHREVWKEAEKAALLKLKENNVQIYYPNKSEFVKLFRPMYKQLISDKATLSLLDEIIKTDSTDMFK